MFYTSNCWKNKNQTATERQVSSTYDVNWVTRDRERFTSGNDPNDRSVFPVLPYISPTANLRRFHRQKLTEQGSTSPRNRTQAIKNALILPAFCILLRLWPRETRRLSRRDSILYMCLHCCPQKEASRLALDGPWETKRLSPSSAVSWMIPHGPQEPKAAARNGRVIRSSEAGARVDWRLHIMLGAEFAVLFEAITTSCFAISRFWHGWACVNISSMATGWSRQAARPFFWLRKTRIFSTIAAQP